MLTDAYGGGWWVGLQYINAYGCLRCRWVGGSKISKCLRLLTVGMGWWVEKISKCLRMLTVVPGSGFGLTLTQKKANFYNLDTEKVNNLQLNTKSQLYPKKTTLM